MEGPSGHLAIVSVLLCIMLLTQVATVSADTHALAPGSPFEVIKPVDSMAYVNYSWTVTPSNVTVHFELLDPDGTAVVDTTANSYDGSRLSLDAGDYTFRWTNNESVSVTLDYDIVSQSTGVDGAEEIFDMVFVGLLVGAVVVVIIIVLVIVVVMRGGRKIQQPVTGHPAEHAPPGETPSPYVPGMCPRCGSPFDSQHTFCPKCGHRVR